MDKIRKAIAEYAEKNKHYAKYHFVAVLCVMIAVEILTMAFPGLMGIKLTLLQLIAVMILYIDYLMFCAYVEEYEKARFINMFKAGCCIFAFYVPSNALFWVQYKLGTHSMTIFALVSGAFFVLLFFAFCATDKGKETFTKLRETSGLDQNEEKEFKPGDVVLCNRKEDIDAGVKDAREIVPYKDRFLHTLILGVTGTGKTSQVLIPMINQDIQNREVGVIVLEPKGDLAVKVKAMAEYYGRDVKYFDPAMDDCPHFNPLAGREMDVVENIATTFRMLNPDSPTFFLDLNEQLIRNAVKVLKRLDKYEGVDGKNATLINLSRLLQNSGGQGRDIIQRFTQIPARTDTEAKENTDICSWFLNDYFPERSKVYENTSGVRSQVAKICSNEFLREVLNPNVMEGEHNDIDFDKALANGEIVSISTAQGSLRGLSQFLGYFLILQLQSAVFRRPGNENTRRACFLYIDEFQTYSNEGFGDMLTMGRSYRVASHLATQARAQIAIGAGRKGKEFVELVSSNARNVVVYPGCSYDDAKYYSDLFGEYEKTEIMTGVSRKRFNLITGGFDRLGHPTESIREQKKMTANFTPTDIMQRPFGEITYRIIKNNSVQLAKVGKISYIDAELNAKLDEAIEKYESEHKRKTEDEKYEERRHQASGGISWDGDESFQEGMELDDPVGGQTDDNEGAVGAVADVPGAGNLFEGIDDEVVRHEEETAQTARQEALFEDDMFGAAMAEAPAAESLNFDALDDSGDPDDGIVDDDF